MVILRNRTHLSCFLISNKKKIRKEVFSVKAVRSFPPPTNILMSIFVRKSFVWLRVFVCVCALFFFEKCQLTLCVRDALARVLVCFLFARLTSKCHCSFTFFSVDRLPLFFFLLVLSMFLHFIYILFFSTL